MNSEAMIDEGIFNGDILIVDRSVKAANDKIIVAIVDGELLVRRLQKTYNNVTLVSANKKMANLTLREFDDRGNVWGVVTWVIHVLEKNLFVTKKNSQFNQKDKYGKEQRFY